MLSADQNPVDDNLSINHYAKLYQNYPNPFVISSGFRNPYVTIKYEIRKQSITKLDIYNLKEQRVINLVNKLQRAGDYEVTWDGKSESGKYVPVGTYFYRLTTEFETKTCKMTVVK